MQTQELLQLFEGAADGAFALTAEGVILAWNSAAQRLLGYGPLEVLGRACYEVFPPRSPAPSRCHPGCSVLQAIRQGRPVADHLLLAQRADGQTARLWCSTVVLPLGNQRTGAVVLFRPEREGAAAEPEALSGEGIGAGPWLTLEVRCFGPFEVLLDGAPLMAGPLWRPRVRALLKHLTLQRDQPTPLSTLLDLLWPDADEATGRRNLKVLVHELNRAIESRLATLGVPVLPPQTPFVLRSDGTYRLSPRLKMQMDVALFQEAWKRGRQWEAQREIEAALAAYRDADSLYRGDYLAGDLYEDWTMETRDRLREAYVDLLRRMAHLLAGEGQMEESIRYCRKALTKDPCREDLHRDLLRYLARAGRRAEALRQYRACRRLLWQELEVEPAPETERLYRDLLLNHGLEVVAKGAGSLPLRSPGKSYPG